MNMKQFLLVSLLAFLLGAPCALFAAETHFDDSYFLKSKEKVAGNLYFFSRSVVLAGDVSGDVVGGALIFQSDSAVLNDLGILGQEVRIGGHIGEDVRAFGGKIVVDGEVLGDVVLVGAQVRISRSAKIRGDVFVAGADASIEGEISGRVKVMSGTVFLGGTVAEDIELWSSEVFVGSDAILKKDFTYHSQSEARIENGSLIEGNTVFDKREKPASAWSIVPVFFSGLISLKILMGLVIAFFLFFLARWRTNEVLLDATDAFFPRMLRGFIIAITTPFVAGLLLFSVIGLPLGIVLVSLYVSALLLSSVIAAFLWGLWLERRLLKRPSEGLAVRPIIIGVFIFYLVGAIPYIGWILALATIFSSLGALGTVFYKHMEQHE